MESLYAQRLTAIAFGACWVVSCLLVWSLHRQWWSIRAVRRAMLIVPAAELASIVLWGVSVREDATDMATVFAVLSGFGLASSIGLVAMLPISGIALSLDRFLGWMSRKKRDSREQISTVHSYESSRGAVHSHEDAGAPLGARHAADGP